LEDEAEAKKRKAKESRKARAGATVKNMRVFLVEWFNIVGNVRQ
jgi:hypothetical protein